MSMSVNCTFLVIAIASGFAAVACADETPQLGTPVSAAKLAEIDYTILPDGDGLPAGKGTVTEGGKVFSQHCIACHGESGTGGINDALVGGQGSLATESPTKTVGSYWPYSTTIFDYVRRAMPLQSPGILNDDEVYAVTAYLLFLNGIVGKESELNAHTLPQVKMPNRDGFVWGYGIE